MNKWWKETFKWWWTWCQVVIIFFFLMLGRYIIDPESSKSRLPKQVYSEVEKTSERASQELESTMLRSLVDKIKE